MTDDMQKFEYAKEEIMQGLMKLGVERGDTIFVHSSLRSIGYVPGGSETVIDALLESVGEGGTVVVPTLTGQIFNSPDYPPSFSRDKPCWTGTIPEAFRKRREAYRSGHPTHSVAAIGKNARKIVEGHEEAKTPCGRGTPYLKLSELGGKILFIGASLKSNTTFHSVEELYGLYYHLQPEPSNCKIEVDGRWVERRFFLHAYGTPRAFDEKEKELLEEGIARVGNVGRARSIVVDARRMIEFALGKIDEDRLYLVKRDQIDLWSLSSSIDLVQGGRFGSMRINLYLPKSATMKFSENHIVVSGVKMDLFGFNLTEGFMEIQSKIVKELELRGGYSYWLRIKRAEQGIEMEVLDFKESDSILGPR